MARKKAYVIARMNDKLGWKRNECIEQEWGIWGYKTLLGKCKDKNSYTKNSENIETIKYLSIDYSK